MKAFGLITVVSLGSVVGSNLHADEMSFDCNFQRICQLEFTCSGDRFAMSFTIDSEAENAVVSGNQGSNEVAFVFGQGGFPVVTFLEHLITGAVQSTTIAASGDAVHSRHTVVNPHSSDALIPSQYRGTCETRNWL